MIYNYYGENVHAATFFVDYDNNRQLTNSWEGDSLYRKPLCPFLNNYDVPAKVMGNLLDSPISLLKEAINLGMYLFTIVDISKITAFQRKDYYQHDFFVFGYDDEKRIIHYADFHNISSGVYNYATCSYEEFITACNSATLKIANHKLCFAESVFFKYDLDFSYVRRRIREYVYPSEKAEIDYLQFLYMNRAIYCDNMKIFSGTNIYLALSQLISDVLRGYSDYLDVRFFHGLHDHKIMMIKRMEFLFENNFLVDSKRDLYQKYHTISSDTLQIRNNVIKFNITQKKSTLNELSDRLTTLRTEECELLKEIFLE
jgi:hypothetical protein